MLGSTELASPLVQRSVSDVLRRMRVLTSDFFLLHFFLAFSESLFRFNFDDH